MRRAVARLAPSGNLGKELPTLWIQAGSGTEINVELCRFTESQTVLGMYVGVQAPEVYDYKKT